ncbi:MAG: hypothetical protein AVDCRST_MAG42-1758, partial [uncultured Chthoniobacterales bacterium]
ANNSSLYCRGGFNARVLRRLHHHGESAERTLDVGRHTRPAL